MHTALLLHANLRPRTRPRLRCCPYVNTLALGGATAATAAAATCRMRSGGWRAGRGRCLDLDAFGGGGEHGGELGGRAEGGGDGLEGGQEGICRQVGSLTPAGAMGQQPVSCLDRQICICLSGQV